VSRSDPVAEWTLDVRQALEVIAMLIRGSRLIVPVDREEDLIAYFTHHSAPETRKLAGNSGVDLLMDRSSGVSLDLSYWEDRAAMDASEEAGMVLRGQLLQTCDGTLEEILRLEVLVQERVGEPRAGRFATVASVQGKPGRIDGVPPVTRNEYLLALRRQRGFVALSAAVSRQSGRGMVVSAWETLHQRSSGEAVVAPIREEGLAAVGVTTLRVESFDSVQVDEHGEVAAAR
jgi:heme-degrading monooxygenase HmoA